MYRQIFCHPHNDISSHTLSHPLSPAADIVLLLISHEASLHFSPAVPKDAWHVSLHVCPECHGQGGFNSHTCPECKGSGTVTRQQSTMFGSFLSRTTCPHCGGTGSSFDKICTSCKGTGKVVKKKTLTVTIPKGVDTGNRLRLAGKGEAGTNGGQPGDLYIEFAVKEDSFYKRDGNDIYIEVPLTIAEAVLGCKKEIPTLYGNAYVTIPDGTKNGTKLRLKGKGIDSDINNKKGDMYVIINVVIPSKINRKQKELFKLLSETELDDDSEFTKYNKKLN